MTTLSGTELKTFVRKSEWWKSVEKVILWQKIWAVIYGSQFEMQGWHNGFAQTKHYLNEVQMKF